MEVDSHKEYSKPFEEAPVIEITRILRAPLEWIWKAWSDPEVFKQWMGPKEYVTKNAESDFRKGGKYLFDLESPNGRVSWSTGVYETIIPNKKIVFTYQFADKDGNTISANEARMPGNWPEKCYITVELEKIADDQIKMVLTHEGIPQEMRDDFVEGWNQTLDKFQEAVERYGDENFKSTPDDLNH